MEISSKDLSLNEKLKILADAAKYDVACTSSGSSRRGKKGMLGIQRLLESVIVFLRMGAVCLCLRFYLAMNVFMIVSIV